eukprot:2720861-Pyramimonas_sp.AAC.1
MKRSKAWRSRYIFEDPRRLQFIQISAFVAVPLDTLLGTLQHSDAVGKSLVDCAWPPTSPVWACQQSIMT